MNLLKDSPDLIKKTVINSIDFQRPPTEIYSQVERHKINKNEGDLSLLFLEITMTAEAQIAIRDNLVINLFKKHAIKAGDKTVAEITNFSMSCRADRLTGTPNEARITSMKVNAAEFATVNTEVVRRLPLMFWFSDDKKNILDLFHREQLYLESTFNKNFAEMGLNDNLLTVKTKLKSCVYERPFYPPVKEITNCYSVYEETPILCLAGSSSIDVLLKCPFEVYQIGIIMKQVDSQLKSAINRLVINAPNKMLLDVSNTDMYEFYVQEGLNFDGSFNYTVGKVGSKEFYKFSQEMGGTIATVHYNTLGADSYLHFVFEHNKYTITAKDGTTDSKLSGMPNL